MEGPSRGRSATATFLSRGTLAVAPTCCSAIAWLTASQQRVQATQDQVQRPDAMPALWQPQPRVHVCAQLLQQLQRVGRVRRPNLDSIECMPC